jgi:uncharacterized protein YwgA
MMQGNGSYLRTFKANQPAVLFLGKPTNPPEKSPVGHTETQDILTNPRIPNLSQPLSKDEKSIQSPPKKALIPKPKKPWYQKLFLLMGGLTIAGGGYVGVQSHIQSQMPIEQVATEAQDVHKAITRVERHVVNLRDKIEQVKQLSTLSGLFHEAGEGQEARFYLNRAYGVAQDAREEVAALKRDITLIEAKEKEFNETQKQLSSSERSRTTVYERNIKWAKELTDIWDKDAQTAFNDLTLEVGFTQGTVSRPPFSLPHTPEKLLSEKKLALESIQTQLDLLTPKFDTQVKRFDKLYGDIDEYVQKFRSAEPRYQKELDQYGRHRPFIFGMDRYKINAQLFQRDLYKAKVDLESSGRHIDLMLESVEKFQGLVQKDASLKSLQPKIDETRSLLKLQKAQVDAQLRSSAFQFRYSELKVDRLDTSFIEALRGQIVP